MACVPDACLVGRLRVWGWNRGEGRLASYLPATGDEASRVGWGRGTRVLPLPVARRRRSLSVATEYIKAGTAMANGIWDLHYSG